MSLETLVVRLSLTLWTVSLSEWGHDVGQLIGRILPVKSRFCYAFFICVNGGG